MFTASLKSVSSSPPHRMSNRRRLFVEHLEDRALLAVGDLDWSFGKSGWSNSVAFDLGGTYRDDVADSAVDSQGRIVVVGTVDKLGYYGDIGVARFLSDGSLDTTFGYKGKAVFDLYGFKDTAAAVAIQPDGKIVIAATTHVTQEYQDSGDSDFAVLRLNADGSRDTNFAPEGRISIEFDYGGSKVDVARDVAIQPDGKIVVVGRAQISGENYDFAFARLHGNGTGLDYSFSTNGKGNAAIGGLFDTAESVLVQPDGKIVLVGYSHFGALRYAVSAARLTSAGVYDDTFSGDGREIYDNFYDGSLPFNEAYGNDVVRQSDGKLVIAVQSGSRVYTRGTVGALRLNVNGTLDTTFGQAGRFLYQRVDNSSYGVESVILQPDGKAVLVGSYRPSVGTADFDQALVIRLTGNGQLDTSFNGNGLQVLGPREVGSKGNQGANAHFINGYLYVTASVGSVSVYYDTDFAFARLQVLPPQSTIVGRAGGQWYAAVGSGNTFKTRATVGWSDLAYVDVRAADVNGDGLDDLIGRETLTGIWRVSLKLDDDVYTTARNFGAWATNVSWQNVRVGDFNGDGRADVAGRNGTTGIWQVGLSQGTKFTTTSWLAAWATNGNWVDVFAADMTGDGLDDLIGRNAANGQWNVLVGNGVKFTGAVWKTWSTAVWSATQVGDVNGDGRADVVSRATSGLVYAALSTGTTLGNAAAWTTSAVPAGTWTDVKMADMTGDGKQDLLARIGNTWYVAVSNGSRFVTVQWGTWPAGTYVDVVVGDFNGDGRLDLAGRSAGKWYVLRNQNANTFAAAAVWGTWSTSLVWKDVQTGRGLI